MSKKTPQLSWTFNLSIYLCHSVKKAKSQQWKDFYLIISTLLWGKPEAHCLHKTVVWVRTRVNNQLKIKVIYVRTCISRCKYCICLPDHIALYFHFYRHEQHHVRFYFLRVYRYLHTNSCYIIIIISSKVWKSVNPNVIFLYFLKYLIVKRSSSLKKKCNF